MNQSTISMDKQNSIKLFTDPWSCDLSKTGWPVVRSNEQKNSPLKINDKIVEFVSKIDKDKIVGGLNKVNGKIDSWITENYQKDKPSDFFKNFFLGTLNTW